MPWGPGDVWPLDDVRPSVHLRFFSDLWFSDFDFFAKSLKTGFATFLFPMHCGIQTPDQRNAKVIPKSRCELSRCDLDSGGGLDKFARWQKGASLGGRPT